MCNLIEKEYKKFEDVKHLDENGYEFWLARELQEILSYAKWENFHKVIKQAMISCKISQQSVEDCFPEVRKPIISGKGKKDSIVDYKLTRYACYLIVMNGDPRKEVIAQGQTYFAVKTRQQELQELYDLLSEDDKRLFLRGDIKQKNMMLYNAAKNAGIETTYEYAEFTDSGYKGLYGGLVAREIAARKGLDNAQEILDYMSSAELGANLFRITQTEEVLKNRKVSKKEQANAVHYEVGKAVRDTIEKIGGTMPEDMPTPELGILEVERKQLKELKNKKKLLDE